MKVTRGHVSHLTHFWSQCVCFTRVPLVKVWAPGLWRSASPAGAMQVLYRWGSYLSNEYQMKRVMIWPRGAAQRSLKSIVSGFALMTWWRGSSGEERVTGPGTGVQTCQGYTWRSHLFPAHTVFSESFICVTRNESESFWFTQIVFWWMELIRNKALCLRDAAVVVTE